MTKIEVIQLRKSLEAKAIEFENSTRRRDGILIEGSADELDRVIGAAERELAVRNLDAASVKHRETRAALHRIREGTYGICAECEEPISAKRLAAVPWAALCIHCQEATDRGSGRPTFAKAA